MPGQSAPGGGELLSGVEKGDVAGSKGKAPLRRGCFSQDLNEKEPAVGRGKEEPCRQVPGQLILGRG